ncbi:recombinase family protein [uncultured Anaeromusa sp.]|uniref:recombinase family protein n=1 Tax=uncultured Anaeromusa sp. TaxID=673273 RepID=UPI0029C90414|nr:recombinase family protein [uncultured Anaeromusa sp.]
MPKMIRTALYVRVSHEEQVMHGYSVEAQKQALTEYARKNNLHIVDYYVDEGQTARKSYKKRKEFIRLMDDVKVGNIDIILFIKLDRWFRNIRDYYKIQDILEKHKVNWKTIFENYDTTTASGRLYINIMLSVAQDEADRTSERINFVFENKIKNGEVITGTTAIGYKIENKKLVIVPDEADLVREAFDYYLLHQSVRLTMKHLNEKYNKRMQYVTVNRILHRKQYTGEHRGNKHFCPPIIDSEVFEKAQSLLKANIRTTRERIYVHIYSGLLKCPLCGRRMTGAAMKPRHILYMTYRCNGNYKNSVCGFNRMIREETIDDYLLTHVEEQIQGLLASCEVKQKPSLSLVSIAGERSKIRSKLEKLKDLYLDNLIDKNTYRRDYEDLTARLSKLDKIDRPEPKRINVSALKSFLAKDIKTIYHSMSREERQMLWHGIIKEIRFDPETLEPQVTYL